MSTTPRVEIDERSGFCNGVVTAIRKAEEELSKGTRPLYCLGDIVHNSDEVERLEKAGLATITHADLSRLSNAKVLLRAHGEPPSTYDTAASRGIHVIDATCPVVLKLQQRIKHTYDTTSPRPQIVIYGKAGHAEVNGLVGQTNGEAIVVEDISQLHRIDFTRDIALYSQTTMSLQGLAEMESEIRRRIAPGVTFNSYDTICRQVANRVGHLRAFASAHDVILFVAGAKSSNGKVLYNECRNVNPRTHLLSTPSDYDPATTAGADSIGICGATSTPRWLMEAVRNAVLKTLLAILLVILPGCSCTDTAAPQPYDVSGQVHDQKAFTLGQNHADSLLTFAHNEIMVQEALLDIRARQSNIRAKFGEQSAQDYERGFERRIRQRSDSLARILF